MESNLNNLFDLALLKPQKVKANGQNATLQYNKKAKCFEIQGKAMQCKPTRAEFAKFCELLKIETT